jgi:hypothetical protein
MDTNEFIDLIIEYETEMSKLIGEEETNNNVTTAETNSNNLLET